LGIAEARATQVVRLPTQTTSRESLAGTSVPFNRCIVAGPAMPIQVSLTVDDASIHRGAALTAALLADVISWRHIMIAVG